MAKTVISVRVHPNAAKNAVIGATDSIWHIRVSAPPIGGKANKELITFLSLVLGVSKSQIDIIRGYTARNKAIAIEGLSQDDLVKQLSSCSGPSSQT